MSNLRLYYMLVFKQRDNKLERHLESTDLHCEKKSECVCIQPVILVQLKMRVGVLLCIIVGFGLCNPTFLFLR